MALATWYDKLDRMKTKERIYRYIDSTKRMDFVPPVGYVCPAVRKIGDAIYSASKEFDLPIPLIMAIIEVESSWRPEVISHKGARGLMQIMPVWDETLIKEGIIENSEQIFDIARNIRAGCWIYKSYLDNPNYIKRYKQTIDGISADWNTALDMYSGGGGDKYITKVRETMARIETFMNGE